MKNPLLNIAEAYRSGEKTGITSVCSAHPVVIEAALCLARDNGKIALIEATCNQVNQDGGYTGMSPVMFREFVEGIARKVGIATSNVILGGDHLGPNPWKDLPACEAMAKAEELIAAYASAGFTKLHLDTSMGCKGEDTALADEVTAERAACLAAIAEKCKRGPYDPVYVIGTEVPVPGGAVEGLDHLQITRSESVALTYDVHRAAFSNVGMSSAFSRVVAMVVQPGVEFGHDEVIHFDAERAESLSRCLDNLQGIIFEAHSTDYQSASALRQLCQKGFLILKVGPWLTFALREALYALDSIADVLEGLPPRSGLMLTMEEIMQNAPNNWKKYYSGDETDLWLQRHFSYSDRIRYYWPDQIAASAVSVLQRRLANRKIPATLLSQFLPQAHTSATASSFDNLLLGSVQSVLKVYADATHG